MQGFGLRKLMSGGLMTGWHINTEYFVKIMLLDHLSASGANLCVKFQILTVL